MASRIGSEAKPWHLSRNYGPVPDKLTRFDPPVTGAIPPELFGLYVRNGANPTGGSSLHDFGPCSEPGEFVLSEASDSAAEDEGYADMSKAELARIHMPRRVPNGFHGSWIRG